MQISPAWQTLREALPGIIGGLILAIPAYIKLWLDRKKPYLEDRESEARTSLAHTSAQSMAIRDGLATGEGVTKMISSLIETGDTLVDLQKQVFELEQDRLELEMAHIQIKNLKGRLDQAEAQLEKVLKAHSTCAGVQPE